VTADCAIKLLYSLGGLLIAEDHFAVQVCSLEADFSTLLCCL